MIKFCASCHREAYRIVREGEQVKVLQAGKQVFSFNDKSSIDIGLACPCCSKPVQLVIKPKEATCVPSLNPSP